MGFFGLLFGLELLIALNISLIELFFGVLFDVFDEFGLFFGWDVFDVSQ